MAISSVTTFAEYAVKKWMREHEFAPGFFTITMNKNEALITDRTGDTLTLVYDREKKEVYVKEI